MELSHDRDLEALSAYVRRGDPQAFESLVRAYQALVVAACVAIRKLETLPAGLSATMQITAEAVGPAVTSLLRRDARAKLYLAAYEVRLFHATQNRWPASLDELPNPVPADPFTGDPFTLTFHDDGFTLTSAGRDRDGQPLEWNW